jgi:dGTPase
VDGAHPGLDPSRRTHELTRRVITRQVEDVLSESARRLDRLAPATPDDIRAADGPVVSFSADMTAVDRSLKAFLFPHLYKHPRLMTVRASAEVIVRDLFARFTAEPQLMPEEWAAGLDGAPDARVARCVADYIAGMTDRFAADEHRRLFNRTPDLRLA